ncbi:MAG: ABC transporter substrate-binding protein [Chloroflexi bacterium]|nr:ABC transporter substrate-binding protein [Chloroflexota bacterium]
MSKSLSRNTWFAVVLAVCLLATFVAASCQSSPSAGAPKTYKVGAIYPLTGSAAATGDFLKSGFEVGMEAINKKGGIDGVKLEPIMEDSQNDAKVAVSAFTKLANVDKVPILSIAFSAPSFAVAPLLQESKVFGLGTTVASPQIRGISPYYLLTYELADREINTAVEYASKELKFTKWAATYLNNDLGKGQLQFLEKKIADTPGASLLAKEAHDPGQTDFSAQIAKIKAVNPDAVYIAGGAVKETALFMKQAKEQGIKAPFLSYAGVENPDTLKIAGAAAEGMLYTTPYFNPEDKDPVIQGFVTEYKAKFNGKVPQEFQSALTYDHTLVMEKIIKYAKDKGWGYTAESLKKAAEEIKVFPATTGTTHLQPDGTVKKEKMLLKTVKDGKYVVLKVLDANVR